MTKICKKCNVSKTLEEFYKYKCTCKICYNQISKTYRKNNKDNIKITRKYWELINKEKRKESRRNQAKEKRKNDPLFALKSSITRNIRTSITRNGFSKNTNTNSILGCSFEYLKEYLESKFENWMSWENRGKYNGEFNHGWDIDHIIPISKSIDKNEIIKLNHYTNLQPLCSKYNRDIKKDNII